MVYDTMLFFIGLCLFIPSLSRVDAYFAPGWYEEHNGTQIWTVTCPESGCGAPVGRVHEKLDILGHHEGAFKVQVPHKDRATATELLTKEGLDYNVTVPDVAQMLMQLHVDERSALPDRISEVCTENNCAAPLKNAYMTFQQMEWFLSDLAKTHPAIVTISKEGQSTEGRSLWLVKVAAAQKTSKANDKVNAVFVEGGAHAREWISMATTLNILYAQVKKCLSGRTDCEASYHFMPAVNPDGYEYSRTNNRLWRKNRSLPPASTNCYGIDLNRNWSFKWGQSGSSPWPCSNIYRGTSPFSAPETTTTNKVLKAIMANTAMKLNLYISYHSYSQLVLHPFGYSISANVPDKAELIQGGSLYRDALRAVHNKYYTLMNSAQLYQASGVGDDYAKSLGIKLAYTMELRDKGTFGFLLPPSQIEPTFEENWAGFKVLVKYAARFTNTKSLLSECVKENITAVRGIH